MSASAFISSKSAKIMLTMILCAGKLFAQSDTSSIVIHKDPRVDLLIKKQIQINEETTREARSHVPGFRIQVFNSPDRNKVFAAKTKVNQDYPELKSYLVYQAPNYKLKLGNFKTEEEADPYIKKLSKQFPSGVYLTHDIIDIKIDKPDGTN